MEEGHRHQTECDHLRTCESCKARLEEWEHTGKEMRNKIHEIKMLLQEVENELSASGPFVRRNPNLKTKISEVQTALNNLDIQYSSALKKANSMDLPPHMSEEKPDPDNASAQASTAGVKAYTQEEKPRAKKKLGKLKNLF